MKLLNDTPYTQKNYLDYAPYHQIKEVQEIQPYFEDQDSL